MVTPPIPDSLTDAQADALAAYYNSVSSTDMDGHAWTRAGVHADFAACGNRGKHLHMIALEVLSL